MDHSSHTVLVYDNGLFFELALKLAETYGRVLYFSPWVSDFPTSNQTSIGKGFPGVTRVNDPWPWLNRVDLWVFPDIYEPGLQTHLAEDLGKRVWGSRYGEDFETERVASKEYLRNKANLPVGPYKVITGLSNLREYLKDHEDQYVKISRTRGDMESFHSPSYRTIEPRLDALEHLLGAKKTVMEFVCEDSIPDAVEIGYDGYSIDGRFPTQACVGIEVKSKGYVGHFLPELRMPEQVRLINHKLSTPLRHFNYRNFFAVEARITKDGTPWIVDPCCRFGSPPSEMLLEMYANLGDILWEGAGGECIDPEPSDEWGVEIILYSDWAEQNWMAVDFPDEIRQNVKLRNCSRFNGRYYVMPKPGHQTQIGAVVATGKTLDEARKKCSDYAAKVEGYGLESHPTSLSEAEEEIQKLKEFGIDL